MQSVVHYRKVAGAQQVHHQIHRLCLGKCTALRGLACPGLRCGALAGLGEDLVGGRDGHGQPRVLLQSQRKLQRNEPGYEAGER